MSSIPVSSADVTHVIIGLRCPSCLGRRDLPDTPNTACRFCNGHGHIQRAIMFGDFVRLVQQGLGIDHQPADDEAVPRTVPGKTYRRRKRKVGV